MYLPEKSNNTLSRPTLCQVYQDLCKQLMISQLVLTAILVAGKQGKQFDMQQYITALINNFVIFNGNTDFFLPQESLESYHPA